MQLLPRMYPDNDTKARTPGGVSDTQLFGRVVARLVDSAAIVLLLTIFLKGVSLVLSWSVEARPDLVLPFLSVRVVWIVAVALEVAVLVFMTSAAQLWRKGYALLWLMAVFVGYRVIWATEAGGGVACPCLGSVVQYLGVPTNTGNWMSGILVAYLSGVALSAVGLGKVSGWAARPGRGGAEGLHNAG